jgi:stage V sporulation protein SpoVS
MSAVVCFVKAVSGGGGSAAAGVVRKKEVLTVPSTSTITAQAGEFAIVLNTETTAILVAYGSTPDAQAATATTATTAGLGIPSGLDSALLGPLAEGAKVDVKVVG